MKHFWIFSPVTLFALILGLNQSPISVPLAETNEIVFQTAPDSLFTYPAKVKAIVDAKCYECHSEKGKDEEAKEDLLWDDLPKLSKIDLMYAMDDIIETLENGEMPPEDYIKDHPKAALTKEEIKILMEWADGIASKIME